MLYTGLCAVVPGHVNQWLLVGDSRCHEQALRLLPLEGTTLRPFRGPPVSRSDVRIRAAVKPRPFPVVVLDVLIGFRSVALQGDELDSGASARDYRLRMTTQNSLMPARRHLASVGFKIVPDRESPLAGQTLDLRRGACIAMLGVDRGQPFLTMRAPGGAQDYHLGLWAACADGVDPAVEARDVAADAELLAIRVDEFEALIQ
jgi:hypothetical protein